MPHPSLVQAHSQIRLVTPLRNPETASASRSASRCQLHRLDPLTTTIEAALPTSAGPILFSLGQVDITPGAVTVLERITRDPRLFLAVHVTGTWGHVDPHRVGLNQAAIDDNYGTVRSLYDLGSLFNLAVTIEIETTLRPESTTTLVLAHGQEADDDRA